MPTGHQNIIRSKSLSPGAVQPFTHNNHDGVTT